MDRRACLGLVASAGCAGVAGCGGIGGPTELSNPVTRSEPGEREMEWQRDGETLCTFAMDGRSLQEFFYLRTEISPQSGTRITTITLRLWLPDSGTDQEIALRTPVEGDGGHAPSITLSSPSTGPGTLVEVTDLGELADGTIRALTFLVGAPDEPTAIAVDATLALEGGDLLTSAYSLTGELRLPIPAAENQ